MTILEFWFDYSCPYAYLASTRVEAMAQRTRATLRWEPMLLGGVFAAGGTPQNLSETLSPSKAKHNLLDMKRWADRFGVPLNMPKGHPMRTVDALRATLASGIDPKVIHGFYRAYWVDGRPVSDRETMREVLSAAGHDADAIFAKLGDYKDDLRVRTERAIARGVFGAPTFVVDPPESGDALDRLYWGQDRMDFVERALGPAPTVRGSFPTPSRPHTLEFFFDFSSPFAYLASTQAEGIAARTGATLIPRPMLLGAVFRAIGQADAPISTFPPSKQRYVGKDLERWVQTWGAKFTWPSRFPMNSVKALRTYLALPDEEKLAFRTACFRAYWAEDRDISSEDVLRELAGEAAVSKIGSQEIKDQLFAATKYAIDAGVFGAPTWVVDGEHLFWGQDRIELVEAALRA
ncbi:MAG: DsbA family protein [Polyangiales bacterium]